MPCYFVALAHTVSRSPTSSHNPSGGLLNLISMRVRRILPFIAIVQCILFLGHFILYATWRFSPGAVLFLDDLTGRGHITRNIEGTRLLAYLPTPPGFSL